MKLRPGTPEEAGMSRARIGLIRQRGREWVEGGVTPSLVLLVARRGVIVLHEAYGVLTPDADSPPLQLDSVFPLQSVTKPITASCIMMLVEEGLVGLNRPVSDYIQEFRGHGRDQIMVHHLLTHTSGITQEDLLEVESSWQWETKPPQPGDDPEPYIAEVIKIACEVNPRHKPGEWQLYLGRGYALLAEILRRVTGERIDRFAQQRIFEPLGITDISWCPDEGFRKRIVRRPEGAFDASVDDPLFLNYPSGNVGAYSTALDLATFCQMILNRGEYGDVRLLSRVSVNEMMRNQIPGVPGRDEDVYFPEAGWTYGWDVKVDKKWCGTLDSSRAIGHVGAGGIYVWIDPVFDLLGVYMSVLLEARSSAVYLWNADLFVNMVTAAVEEV